MTPSDPSAHGQSPDPAEEVPAVFACLITLTKRSDFLLAARGLRAAMPGFVLQARQRGGPEGTADIRVGYTCSKKVGNSVARNRAKRRMREVARQILPTDGVAGWDYVLIGRAEKTASLPFEQLKTDLRSALAKIHKAQR